MLLSDRTETVLLLRSDTRKVLFFSGSRADYGRLNPIWRAVKEHPVLSMVLVVSGAHLDKGFGYTRDLFDLDGFQVDYELPILDILDDRAGMGKALGSGLVRMDEILGRELPDFVFVFGDRSEMLIPAIAAVHRNIPVVHMGGGFATFGLVDEVVRHALTKMAHLHLATSKRCMQRILQMGEEPHRVHFVGSPAVDSIMSTALEKKELLYDRYGLNPDRPLALVTYHPVTTEFETMEEQTNIFFDALFGIEAQLLITYPNFDLGGQVILEKLKNFPNCVLVRDLTQRSYLSFLKYANIMVGNSSSGFIEAPYFALPVINVGNRQMGRDREVNIVDVENDRESIIAAANNALKDTNRRNAIENAFDRTYGNGTSALLTMEILHSVQTGRALIQKRITY